MGVQEFTTTVAGQAGNPVATAPNGTIQTDNYSEAQTADTDGSNYPITLNPAFTIQEILVVQSANVVLEITTATGTTFDIPLNGATMTIDTVVIDKVVIKDPNGTTAPSTVVIAGE